MRPCGPSYWEKFASFSVPRFSHTIDLRIDLCFRRTGTLLKRRAEFSRLLGEILEMLQSLMWIGLAPHFFRLPLPAWYRIASGLEGVVRS